MQKAKKPRSLYFNLAVNTAGTGFQPSPAPSSRVARIAGVSRDATARLSIRPSGPTRGEGMRKSVATAVDLTDTAQKTIDCQITSEPL
jgi:hypothetical protein